MADFLEKMRALEARLLQAAVDNSETWFGKKMSRDIVTEFAKKFVRDPNDPKYAPTMRVKVPFVDGKIGTEFFDEHKKPMAMDEIVKGCVVRMIIELSDVWFMGGRSLGVTWRARQVRVVSKPGRLDGYSFVDDDDANGAEGVDMVEDE
jgi:Family of unknown function (DUF5871)